MKRNLLTLLIVCITLVSQAQKVKVKGEVLLVDKKEIGTMIGEVSLKNPAKYTVTSVNGNIIYKIDETFIKYNHPLVEDIYYYEITFGDSQKSLKLKTKARCMGPKCLVKKLINEVEIVPSIDGIGNQDEIISKYDNSKEIETDTIKGNAVVKRFQELAKTAQGIERDKTAPINFELVSSNTTGWITNSERNILQDDTHIGEVKMEAANSEISGRETTYWITKKLSEPQMIGGEEKDRAIIAWAEASSLSVEVYIFENGETKTLTKVADPYNAIKEIVSFLTQNNYL